ncbi:MAG: type IX secretion system protein PorQ [Cyclobacteriaceae bacterium]|nr:type IX secretion system protein PorQ [Cyclobacteriaceae bacterium]
MYRFIFGIVLIAWSDVSWAQLGGRSSYEFLALPTHARLGALGGVNVSHADRDLNFFFSNPALSSDSLSGWASAGYLFHVANVGQATFAGTYSFNKIGAVSFGVQHINYGDIEGFDETGLSLGTFRSGETALVISKSHQVSNFRLGINLKTVFSNLAGFRSSALLVDIGGLFIHPSQDITVGLSIQNVGFVLQDYTPTEDSVLPFDVQAGITFKPEQMPVRFSFTAYKLTKPGNVYDDPNAQERLKSLHKVLSHINFGAEILVHRNVNVLAGYNFLRQYELRSDTGGGGGGFTVGVAAKVKAFDFVVSRSRYGIGQANYAITLNANLNNMILMKKTL